MKLVFWNVSSLHESISNGFLAQFDSLDADFVCLANTASRPGDVSLFLPGYLQYWEKDIAVFTKFEPCSVITSEGYLYLEYPEFILTNGPSSISDTSGKPIICFHAVKTDGMSDPFRSDDPSPVLVSNDLTDNIYQTSRYHHLCFFSECPYVVSLDLPCNGSIFSPASEGNAQFIPAETVHEAEAPPCTPKKPRSHLLVAAAIVLMLVLIPLVWSQAQPQPVTVPDDLVPFQLTVLKSAPLPIMDPGTSYFHPDNVIENKLLFDSQIWYTDTFDFTALNSSSFWLQVNLTEEALTLADSGWSLTAQPAIIPHHPHSPVLDLQILQYYADPERTQHLGYFVLGRICDESCLEISISREDSDYRYDETADLLPRLVLSTPDHPITVDSLSAAPFEGNDDPNTPENESYVGISCVQIKGQTYFINNNSQIYLAQNASYWIFVQADNYLVEELGYHALDLNIITPDGSDPDALEYFTRPSAYALYSDAELTNPAGWLIYDDNAYVSSLTLSLTWWGYGEEITYTTTVPTKYPEESIPS